MWLSLSARAAGEQEDPSSGRSSGHAWAQSPRRNTGNRRGLDDPLPSPQNSTFAPFEKSDRLELPMIGDLLLAEDSFMRARSRGRAVLGVSNGGHAMTNRPQSRISATGCESERLKYFLREVQVMDHPATVEFFGCRMPDAISILLLGDVNVAKTELTRRFTASRSRLGGRPALTATDAPDPGHNWAGRARGHPAGPVAECGRDCAWPPRYHSSKRCVFRLGSRNCRWLFMCASAHSSGTVEYGKKTIK
jgi:hypothetical protein